MIRPVALLVVTAVVGPPLAGQAPSRPDLSGEWVLADSADRRPPIASQGDASFRVGSPGSGWGTPVTLTQQGNQLTVQYTYFTAYDLQPPIRLQYALDGSESRNSVMIGHATSEQRTRAEWQGEVLVLNTVYPAPAGSGGSGQVEVRQRLSLDTTGRLVVETTRVGFLGAAATSTRSLYTRRA